MARDVPVATQQRSTSLRDLWNVIKRSPSMMIAIVAGLALILYIVYKNSAANSSTSSTSTTQPGSYYVAYVEDALQGPQGTPGPAGPPGTTGSTGPAGPSGPVLPFPTGTKITAGGGSPQRWWAQLPNGQQICITGQCSNPLLPAGIKISPGGSGRWWYSYAGSNQAIPLVAGS